MLFTVMCGFKKKKMNKDGDINSNESQRNAFSPFDFRFVHVSFGEALVCFYFYFLKSPLLFITSTILSFSHLLHLLTPSLSVCVAMEMLQTSWGISK